ncbi:MAG: 3-phosphoserine/phosphohydroxythreonine transaminase [Candidatus Tectomicrobia bacterium]|uniref:Phosphoserine aminotransferase n=1 Tax=Tectimicrobiota bacterium TaxID=2528274 RepID=A0A937VXP2_UNCTE|nr:3-phosphoserine/phosphohydroxythreonine transaminase [Candidatus Tectomicrobia bacterium]
MTTERIHNFNPGPAALPRAVLEQVQCDLLDYAGTGMSVMELSHRSSTYEQMHHQAIADVRALLGGAEEHAVLFMGGGAHMQFALVALNLLPPGTFAEYLVTGVWSETALREARKLGDARVLWSSATTAHTRVPMPGEYHVDAGAAYLHYTSNNTIVGTQYTDVPVAHHVPLVCDMSSDLLSRPVALARYGLIYAGAQKNLGPAGVTVVLIRRDLLERCRPDLPATMSYAQMAEHNSLLNTPPVFAIYVLGLVSQHLLVQGGLDAAAARNRAKADWLYATLDNSAGFYRGWAQPDSRSWMNVTFRLPTPELEAQFVAASTEAGLIGLAGHRAVGGIRASLYNAVSIESVRALVTFMEDFQQRYA